MLTAKTAGVGVDDAGGDSDAPAGEPNSAAAPGAQLAGGGTERQHLRRNLAGEVSEADRAEQVFAEGFRAPGNSIYEVSVHTLATSASLGAPDEIIGEVEEAPTPRRSARESSA